MDELTNKRCNRPSDSGAFYPSDRQVTSRKPRRPEVQGHADEAFGRGLIFRFEENGAFSV